MSYQCNVHLTWQRLFCLRYNEETGPILLVTGPILPHLHDGKQIKGLSVDAEIGHSSKETVVRKPQNKRYTSRLTHTVEDEDITADVY